MSCWAEVATLSCIFSFHQQFKLNSLLSVVNLFLKLSRYNCSIHKVLWTRNWLGWMVIWNFNVYQCKLPAQCMNYLSSHWKKLMLGCFSFLSQIFPCFPSLFHMLIDTMVVSFNQSFQYHWFTDNMAVFNFCNDFASAKIDTWKWCKTAF